jgi:ubiquinone/menaquinone biosynthesis C-methylase UbiE
MAIKVRKYQYQYGFSDIHESTLYNSENRQQKAKKMMAVINDYLNSLGKKSENLSLLDIGCSTGYMTKLYGDFFERVTGIDIDEKAINHAQEKNSNANVAFQVGDSMNLKFSDNSFDVVTCTHIYEHVPDANQLMAEIYRILKPGGFCYFAAGNRIKFMEAHYQLPLLSIIPKWLANYYIRWAGKANYYYENHLSLWELKKLVEKFEIIDYTYNIVQQPEKFFASEMLDSHSIKQEISLLILKFFYWACPTYIWILKKTVQ